MIWEFALPILGYNGDQEPSWRDPHRFLDHLDSADVGNPEKEIRGPTYARVVN